MLNIEITHHKNIENRSQKYCPYEIHFTCREIVSAAPYLYVCADFVFSNYYLIIFVALIINLCVCVCVHCSVCIRADQPIATSRASDADRDVIDHVINPTTTIAETGSSCLYRL